MKTRILIPALFVFCCAMFAATITSFQQIRGRSESASLFPGADWPRSTPEEQGLDSDRLAEMLEEIRDAELRVRSVLIVRNGHLVLESYIHPYGRDVIHDVKSVSKSVISALVGIAIRDSVLDGLDQPVSDFLPQYAAFDSDSLKDGITIGHLLTMTSGLDVDENGPAMNEIIGHDDWVEATFARPMLHTPGDSFKYCTFLSLAMTRVLTEASGTDLLSFSNARLFGPLGIENVHWERDAQGYYFGGDRLWLRPIDMAKIGTLFLDGGRWRNRQIVPESWVAASTTNQVAGFSADGYSGYGYWWWLPEDGYRARGAFGQIITVYPGANMVVVFTGASNEDWERLTNEYILPALSDDPTLPSNEQGASRLRSLTEELVSPRPVAPRPLPGIAGEISGKTFALAENDLEFSAVTFWFEGPDAGRVVFDRTTGPLDLAFGLDGVYRISHGVTWGMRTDGNTFALRGKWDSDDRIVLEFQEVGEPFYFDVGFEFETTRVVGTWTWQPIGWVVSMEGDLR